MVNAVPHKRTTSFGACPPPEGSHTQIPVLQVSLSTDPPVAGQKDAFTVSGKFTKDVTDQTKLVIAFVDIIGKKPIQDPTTVPACTGSGCPIKAGDQYTQTVEVQAPENLPVTYALVVGVGNSIPDPLGCAFAIV
ncbi:15829_t:CDS:1 [Funneliformis mosseae]|uniref:Phosphatidylglycerol/phosphatidylinositol transfer protein n=1 Tax=Funneliformis mosseae TaxID=27381 RepID=A0A9N9C3S1_FUNMO|nr:15829_t:CDS:1 [Funneliformis mosseae]